jgi:hypothetical protein
VAAAWMGERLGFLQGLGDGFKRGEGGGARQGTMSLMLSACHKTTMRSSVSIERRGMGRGRKVGLGC